MKTKNHFNCLIFVTTVVFFWMAATQASEEQKTLWNEKAESKILNKTELEKIGPAFESWKIKQIAWPSLEEIKSKNVTVNNKLKKSCVEWLKRFMAKEYLPPELEKNLIAMKEWGLITEESKQKRLCDVFIMRFKKDNFVIHIHESPGNVVITVSDERLDKKPRTDYRDWVLEVAALVLNFEKLKPNPDLIDVHVGEIERDNSRITRVSWLIGSVTTRTDSEIRKVSGLKAAKIGASHVAAETTGNFITFSIPKEIGGPTNPDPYTERFSSQSK
ncbi:MAG: hypothetical protein JW715_04980 [Sedimentisphaerales bacterium]|nr:hypothetical protein [Sedimentisphaerales bacterium]